MSVKPRSIARVVMCVIVFALTTRAEALDGKKKFTALKLREYCAACHDLGDLRFIYDDNDDNLWKYIFTNDVPGKTKLWAQRIVEVLSWPSDQAPPADQTDWMPRGIKRFDLAQDVEGGTAVRRIILDALTKF